MLDRIYYFTIERLVKQALKALKLFQLIDRLSYIFVDLVFLLIKLTLYVQ